MAARTRNGWLEVDCDAPGHAQVSIAINGGDPVPAFRDYGPDGRRVAKIRTPGAPGTVVTPTLHVNGSVTKVAGLRIT